MNFKSHIMPVLASLTLAAGCNQTTKQKEKVQTEIVEAIENRDVKTDTAYINTKFVLASETYKNNNKEEYEVLSTTPQLNHTNRYISHIHLKKTRSEVEGDIYSDREGSAVNIIGFYTDKNCTKEVTSENESSDIYMLVNLVN